MLLTVSFLLMLVNGQPDTIADNDGKNTQYPKGLLPPLLSGTSGIMRQNLGTAVIRRCP